MKKQSSQFSGLLFILLKQPSSDIETYSAIPEQPSGTTGMHHRKTNKVIIADDPVMELRDKMWE